MKTRILEWLHAKLSDRAWQRPYFHIIKGGEKYMLRFWVFGGSYRDQRNEQERGWKGTRIDQWIGRWVCARLHHTLRSDSDRHMHDHPSWSISLVLSGGYFEITPKDQHQDPLLDGFASHRVDRWHGPGSIIFRRATDRHRLVIVPGNEPWSLFVIGPVINPWGFYTQAGKIPWRKYLGLEEAPGATAPGPYPDPDWRD